jgi:probable HAF family extracellular repeat protein
MMGRALLGALVLAWMATVAWSQSLTWLGTLPGGGGSAAYGVSANGRVVVGWAQNAAGQQRAFRWTAATGMQDLGTLGGNQSEAYGVSADGAVVVGGAENAAGQVRAFRWTASGGIEDLNLTYVNVLSCSVTPGSVLTASAISPDGRYIVGQGYNAATGRYEAFLLDTQAPFSPNGDVNHDGCVDDIDMMGVLFEFGELVNDFNRCVDVNRDGIIDDADLLIVLFNFGSGC